MKVIDYIADHNLAAAVELTLAIEAVTSALPENPHLYRFGRMPGTREIVVRPNYLVIYRVTDQIDILAVLHARQKFPEGIQGEI